MASAESLIRNSCDTGASFLRKCIQGTETVFRYAERDHEELVALSRQREVMGQKFARKSSQNQVEEGPALEPAVAVPLIQIFVEMPTNPKRTIVLMMRPSSTVKEVKEMVVAKEGGIPVARQRLRTRGGKCLLKDELTLEEYGVSKETTLICSATSM